MGTTWTNCVDDDAQQLALLIDRMAVMSGLAPFRLVANGICFLAVHLLEH